MLQWAKEISRGGSGTAQSNGASPAQSPERYGYLAETRSGKRLKLRVCRSNAGYYLGTNDGQGMPVSRESAEYWPTRPEAELALATGIFTQRANP
ncbi:MAG: hypothetical protein QM750_19820 [Rubrivivax sp.]